MPSGRIVIIGGGPAGLGAAHRLDEARYPDWLLLEREPEVGGLSSSFVDGHGFTWDLGGHVVFSHYDLFSRLLDELLGNSGWIEHERESWIRILGTWVPYPFQNNLHRLPIKERAACAAGLVQAALNRTNEPSPDFDEFIVRTFGAGVADLFMRPYNFKVWAYRPEHLASGWIAERVSVPDPVRVVRNTILGQDDCAWGPNNRFRFPARGGTGAIWRALARRLPASRIACGREVVSIDLANRRLELATGAAQPYDHLLSTMPVDRLTALTDRSDLSDAAAGLVHSAAHIIGVGLRGSPPLDLASKCWMYFPEANCPFYRVTHFSLYSPGNVADSERQWSLMCEVSESPEKPVDADAVVGDTVRGLVTAGLIAGEDLVSHCWHRRIEYAYPTPTPGRDRILRQVLPELERLGVLSRGRFGSWLYEIGNMDHSFMQGYDAAGHIVDGSPESVFRLP